MGFLMCLFDRIYNVFWELSVPEMIIFPKEDCLKVLTAFRNNEGQTPVKRAAKKHRGSTPKFQKERQRLSDNEVRQKIAQLSKGRIAKKGIGKMADGGYPDGTKKLEIKVGGIGYNNPSDPMTREKLKVILRKDAFGFSEKERSVLGKILKDSQ